MANLTRASLAIAICSTVSMMALPSQSFAGVMPITGKAAISMPGPVQTVDWRPYRHRHHRWHYGWHYGWPRTAVAGSAYASAPASPCASGYPYGYAPGYSSTSGGFNPIGALFGAAADVATAPVWGTETALGYPTSPPYPWW